MDASASWSVAFLTNRFQSQKAAAFLGNAPADGEPEEMEFPVQGMTRGQELLMQARSSSNVTSFFLKEWCF